MKLTKKSEAKFWGFLLIREDETKRCAKSVVLERKADAI